MASFTSVLNVVGFILAYVLFSSIKSTNGQLMRLGSCPKVIPMKNFNTTAYAGTWHEVERYWFLFEATTTCVRVHYYESKNDDGSFGVEISQFDNLLRTTMINPGWTRFISDDGSADLMLDLEITQSPVPFVVKYPYMVIDTDYKSYTIKWTCTNTGPMNMQSLWILSRTKTLPPQAKKVIYNVLKENGISTSNIRKSDPNRCS